jgi:hypothetical protein
LTESSSQPSVAAAAGSEREQRKLPRQTAQRNYGRAVAIGALILSAVLLIFPGTRGAGLMMLILAGLLLYLIIGRKRPDAVSRAATDGDPDGDGHLGTVTGFGPRRN